MASIDEVLEEIQVVGRWRGLFLTILLITTHMCITLALYFPALGGYVPYTSWRCLSESEVCRERVQQHTTPDGPSPYTKAVLCGSNSSEPELLPGLDMEWTWNSTSYAVDWGLVCGEEYKGTLLSSLFFVGGAVGLLLGAGLFDTVGRRRVAMVGHVMVALCMGVAAAAPSLPFLMACRVLLGVGCYLGLAGTYIYLLELTATRHRGFISSVMGFLWGLGLGLLGPGLSMALEDWRLLCGVEGAICIIAASTWLLFPESPRHLLENKGDEEGAMAALRQFAKLYGGKFNAEKTQLVRSNTASDGGRSSLLESLREFSTYPELRVQLGVQLWQWIVVAFLYYGFNFGWSKLGSNLYLSYLFAGVAEIVAGFLAWAGQDLLGRKRTILITFLLAAASFLLALVPLSFGEGSPLSLEQLMCLLGSTMVSLCWGTMYLYVNEAAPTSHRGKVSAACSLAARIGSFAGPQASLLFDWNRPVTLAFFSLLAASSGLLTLRLPETRGRQSPNSAAQVQALANEGHRSCYC